jgi:hypothetical protein
MNPACFAVDRAVLVPAGQIIKTARVGVWKCRLANRERMAVGDVGAAFQKILQLGDSSMWPCPNGHWEGDEFVIHDGRHEYVASVMLGREEILVAWLE